LFNDAIRDTPSDIDRIMTGKQKNIWNEAIMVQLKSLPQHSYGGSEESEK
jgi:hypothetical protein